MLLMNKNMNWNQIWCNYMTIYSSFVWWPKLKVVNSLGRVQKRANLGIAEAMRTILTASLNTQFNLPRLCFVITVEECKVQLRLENSTSYKDSNKPEISDHVGTWSGARVEIWNIATRTVNTHPSKRSERNIAMCLHITKYKIVWFKF